MLAYDQPNVVLLEVPVAGATATRAALAVKTAGRTMVIHSLDDAAKLSGELESLDAVHAEPELEALRRDAQPLSRQLEMSAEVERQSVRAGTAQRALTLAAGASLLDETVADHSVALNLALTQIRADYAERAGVNLSKLPKALMEYQPLIVGTLAPSATNANFCRYLLQPPFLEVTLGSAGREAKAMHRRGPAIPVDTVVRRLSRTGATGNQEARRSELWIDSPGSSDLGSGPALRSEARTRTMIFLPADCLPEPARAMGCSSV